MPRVIQVVVPADRTEEVLAAARDMDGLVGLQVQRSVSIKPPGDLVILQVLNRAMPQFMHLLDHFDLTRSANASLYIALPNSLLSQSSNRALVTDSSESSWEEMESMIARESNMTLNALVLMAASGFMMAIAILNGSLHLAIGAMVIAPGFEPLLRISLGITSSSWIWQRGVIDTLKTYSALLLGALLGTLLNAALQPEQPGGYLAPQALVSYWSSTTPQAVMVSTIASIAGAILIATNRSVLTGGVMIALALVPAPTLAIIGAVNGDFTLTGLAMQRWLVEVLLVVILSALVFAWKRYRVHKRTNFW